MRRARWRELTPELVLDMMMDDCSDRPRPVVIEGTIDRCMASPDYRLACERLGFCHPYSGTNAHYCSKFPMGLMCPHLRPDWQHGIPVMLSAPDGDTFAADHATSEMKRLMWHFVAQISGEDNPHGATARAYLGDGDWSEVDALKSRRRSVRSNRELRQYDLAAEVVRRMKGDR